MNNDYSRRQFIQNSFGASMAFTGFNNFSDFFESKKRTMRFGLVTYQWGKDWNLDTLIDNCEKNGFFGVELRTQHAHKVEINLNKAERREVKKKFANSKVTCIGYGSNFEYHSPDAKIVRQNIEQTKEYILLCKDIGASGIKVKPNNLPPEIEKEKTIAQIAASLNECGKFASDYGQLVRLEVHGNISREIPNIKAIFEQITEPNVKICWNSNETDLLPLGLENNFNSVKKWFGDTVHVRELDDKVYPFQQLISLFYANDYKGWILLEGSNMPKDIIASMKEQMVLFNSMLVNSALLLK
jgi:sugar phosphate isomerase/epimerase